MINKFSNLHKGPCHIILFLLFLLCFISSLFHSVEVSLFIKIKLLEYYSCTYIYVVKFIFMEVIIVSFIFEYLCTHYIIEWIHTFLNMMQIYILASKQQLIPLCCNVWPKSSRKVVNYMLAISNNLGISQWNSVK